VKRHVPSIGPPIRESEVEGFAGVHTRSLVWGLAVLLSLAPILDAQEVGGIRGTVYDKDFDVPLVACQVLIVETDEKTTTTDEGNYVELARLYLARDGDREAAWRALLELQEVSDTWLSNELPSGAWWEETRWLFRILADYWADIEIPRLSGSNRWPNRGYCFAKAEIAAATGKPEVARQCCCSHVIYRSSYER